MLVHKATMGVLDEIWDGTYRKQADGSYAPVSRHTNMADFPELSPEDWWEIPDTSPLAARILRSYPFICPVMAENGELLDVVPLSFADQEREAEKKTLDAEAARRGYKKRGCVRPKGLFPFLSPGGETSKL